MEGKDNRQNDKRSSMKQHKKSHIRKKAVNENSSSQKEISRGALIDVADSSDERIFERPKSWSSKAADSELEIETDNEQMYAADFNLLSQMPSSVGGHFQFSFEKIWDEEEMSLDKTEASVYFTLNLNLLNVGLQTVPFYKRLDFAPSWFTKSQLKAMDSAAEDAEKKFQYILENQEGAKKSKFNETLKNSNKEPNNLVISSLVDDKKVGDDSDKDLDELLNLTNQGANFKANDPIRIDNKTQIHKISEVLSPEVANRDGIQQWLDDVLEE